MDACDVPAVAVLDPVAAAAAQCPVVVSGDDQLPGRCPVAVGQLDLAAGCGAVESEGAGVVVELGDEVAGGGEHDRVQTSLFVGRPRGQDLAGDGGGVGGVEPLGVGIERNRGWVAIAEGEAGGGFGWIGEPEDFLEPAGAVGCRKVGEDTAGGDRGQLVGIPDQTDTPAEAGDMADD